MDDYREDSHARDLAKDLHSLHLKTQTSKAIKAHQRRPPSLSSKESSPKRVHYSSAQFFSSDKYCIPTYTAASSTRPLSLPKFGSKVQDTNGGRRPIQGGLSKSQLLPLKNYLQPLKLQSPPGTAPLPVKFSKKTPDKSPSSWFSPVRQKDMRLPIKKSFTSESDIGTKRGISRTSSLNDSMVVLLDTGSQRDLKGCMIPPSVNVKFSSTDSVVTSSALSSMESLRSSMSEGNKSNISNESAIGSFRGSSLGSDSSLVVRPLNLSAPHRSLIQSAKFQILSPISDKSQEPSLETGGGLSQKASPQDFFACLGAKTPIAPQTPRNIPEDFRNVHHILPGPPLSEGNPGSDSGISIEYKLNPKKSHNFETPFHDLPFDMPKLRRRLAAKPKPSLSSSNSSISSSATGSDAVARRSLPTCATITINQPQNPTIIKLQVRS